MKDGESSKTAELVCMARAAAHGQTRAAKYADPTALAFLSDEGRATFARLRSVAAQRSFKDRLQHKMLYARADMMVARTVAIDEAIRGSARPQLVNLGAGLDGRAWRMPELEGTLVFEVDHPASQQQKRERARAASLSQTAREVRFVPVDFTRDSLDEALAKAGHDAQQPTVWIWEGVVPYLTPAEVEATLSIVQRRSAKGSRLAIAYQTPMFFTRMVGLLMMALAKQHVWKNEPLRSWWRPEEMRALLERAGFRVVSDEDVAALAATHGADLARTGRLVRSGRVVVAQSG